MSNVILQAINSSNIPAYHQVDSGTGRCRLSFSRFTFLKLRLGSILRIELIHNDNPVITLCTCWPDTMEILEDSDIALDDSVVASIHSRSWTNCKCKIIAMYPPKRAVSVRVQVENKQRFIISSIRGLPVSAGFFYTIKKSESTKISFIDATPSVITNTTTVVVREHNETSTQPRDTSTALKSACHTNSVLSLYKSLIVPRVSRNDSLNPITAVTGILLLGAPGVGKSFSVKALKQLYEDIIQEILSTLPSKPSAVNNGDQARNTDTPNLETDTLDLYKTPKTSHVGPKDVSTICTSGNSHTPSPSFRSTSGSSGSAAVTYRKNNTSVYSPASRAGGGRRVRGSIEGHADGPIGSDMRIQPTYLSMEEEGNEGFIVQHEEKSAESPKSFSFNTPGSNPIKSNATSGADKPSLNILLIDEIDGLGRGDSSQSEAQMAIKSVLKTWMDELSLQKTSPPYNTTVALPHIPAVVATSNRAEDVDISLRRGGRLEMEIEVYGGSVDDRIRVLNGLLESVSGTSPDERITLAQDIAEATGGYSAADLVALASESLKILDSRVELKHTSMSNAVNRLEEPEAVGVGTTHDMHERVTRAFAMARDIVKPSCLRGATISVPKIRLSDVIGYEEAKKALTRIISLNSPTPSQRSRNKRFGLSGGLGGALLWGPPGNSKTRLVLAVAAQHNLPVIRLGAADVFSPYVGDSEATIRRAFRLVRQSRPCVLLLDEFDSLLGNRDHESGSSAETRVMATLLSEMDGISGDTDGVIVLGATNRLECIDAALLRKGRFHQLLHISPPDKEQQHKLLHYFCDKYKLSAEIRGSLENNLRDGMSGADVENLCREAGMTMLREIINSYSSDDVNSF